MDRFLRDGPLRKQGPSLFWCMIEKRNCRRGEVCEVVNDRSS